MCLRFGHDRDGVRTGVDHLFDRQGWSGLPELLSSGGIGYIHSPEGIVAQINTSTEYSVTDALGSVRAVTDPSGTTIGNAAYDVFGAVQTQTGTTTLFGYTGAQQSDDLVYLNARYLTPDVGRFLSVDPIRPGAPGVTGYNPYTYVANNPTTWTDPTGTTALTADAILRILILTAVVGIGSYAAFKVGEGISECLASGACAPSAPPRTRDDTTSENQDDFARWERELNRQGLGQRASEIAKWAIAACTAIATVDVVADLPEGPCDGDRPVIFHTDRSHTDRFDVSQATDHIQDAILDINFAWFTLQQGPNGSTEGWYTKAKYKPLCVDVRGPGQHCDEYPPIATIQGGENHDPLPSLRPISRSHNERSGGSFREFYRQCAKGEPFGVVPIHFASRLPLPLTTGFVIAKVPTFWAGCSD